MGVLYDYFSAESDDEAAKVLGWVGGPGSPPPDRQAKDFVGLKIDPYVQMGTLEALLTGRPYDEITNRPRHACDIAPGPGVDSEQGVMALTDEFADALATATDAQLAAAAEPWAGTDEFSGWAEPRELEEVMRDLRGLAQRASEEGRRLYCWMSL
jgi:hypothetical protein